MCKLFFVPSNTPAFNWFSYLWRSDRLSYVLVTTDRFWTEIQALLDLSFPLSLLLSSLLASADPCFPCSVSSFSVVGCELCRVRRDRALPAAALFWNQKKKKKAESERRGMLNWLVVWLNIFRALSQAKHMVPVLIKQLFWGGECARVEGWYPVAVSAEPCVEPWRHRWRFERCQRRVLRNREPAKKEDAVCVWFPAWTSLAGSVGFRLSSRSSRRNNCG